MKALLYKQLRLVCHPMTPVFCLFGIMVIIPNYPYTVIFFYVTLGLFFSFLNMREQKDLYYTALLPVPKRDAVKAGCLFTALIELTSLVLLAPCCLLAAMRKVLSITSCLIFFSRRSFSSCFCSLFSVSTFVT